MMPSFHGWQKAQDALAYERYAAAQARERKAPTRRRWPLVLAAIGIVAIAIGLERGRGTQGSELSATTPVEEMQWRSVDAPSGAFHASFPETPRARAVVTAAGSGEQLELRMPQTTVAVSAFAVSGPRAAHELVRPILDERAEALDGRADGPHPVGARVGEAFEGFVRTTTAVAVVRVIIDGTMLYVIEVRGDVESTRTRQIYDRVVLSFAAGV